MCHWGKDRWGWWEAVIERLSKIKMGKEQMGSVSEGNKEAGQGKSTNVSTHKSDAGPSHDLGTVGFPVLKTESTVCWWNDLITSMSYYDLPCCSWFFQWKAV